MIEGIDSTQPVQNFQINWSLYPNQKSQQTLSGSQLIPFSHSLKCEQDTCFKCINFPSNCVQCKEGYILIQKEKKCVKDCLSNTVFDSSINVCKTCFTQPNVCTQCDPKNLSVCLKCADSYKLSSTGYCYIPISSSQNQTNIPPIPSNQTHNQNQTVPNSTNQDNTHNLTTSQNQFAESKFNMYEILYQMAKQFLLTSLLAGCVLLSLLVKFFMKIFQKKKDKTNQFVWVSGILFLANIVDFGETPYILISLIYQSYTISQPLPTLQIQQLGSVVYIFINFCAYLYCLIIIISTNMKYYYSNDNVFWIFKTDDYSRLIGEKDKTQRKISTSQFQNDSSKVKQMINFMMRCIICALGKFFCILYSNIANVEGWFTCKVNTQRQYFYTFYRILRINTILNILGSSLFAAIMMNTPFSLNFVDEASSQIKSSSSSLFGSMFDLLIFKFFMSLICYANCSYLKKISQFKFEQPSTNSNISLSPLL